MPPAKDPRSLLWEHQLKRQHRLLSERLDQIDSATADFQAAMEKRILEHRQATEATIKNLEARLTFAGDQIRSLQKNLAAANEEQQRLTREVKEDVGGLTRKVETLQSSSTASEETLQQIALSEKTCALLVTDLQGAVDRQGLEYKTFKERLEETNRLLDGRLQDLELYGSTLPVAGDKQRAVPGVTANTKTATEDIAIPSQQPPHDLSLADPDPTRSIRNQRIDLLTRKAGVPVNAVRPPQQVLHDPQRSDTRQAPSASSKKPVEKVGASKSSAAATNAVTSLQQARKETPIVNTKNALSKPPLKNSPRRSRRIAGTTSAQLEPPAQIAVPASSPTNRGRKRDFNGMIKLRVPTVIVPESPVQSRVVSPFRDQDTGFAQRTPTQLFQRLQASQQRSQQPRQALSAVKNTNIRLNAPEKEDLPPAGPRTVHAVENEYTKVHVDPRDPTRIKRRRQIPSAYSN